MLQLIEEHENGGGEITRFVKYRHCGAFILRHGLPFLFKRGTERDNQRPGRVGLYPLLDLHQPLVLLRLKIRRSNVDEVDHRLGREKKQGVDKVNV